jgi:hypothetical protein
VAIESAFQSAVTCTHARPVVEAFTETFCAADWDSDGPAISRAVPETLDAADCDAYEPTDSRTLITALRSAQFCTHGCSVSLLRLRGGWRQHPWPTE